MEQNCDVVEPRSIPSIIHHFQRFFTHTYCGLYVLYNFIAMIVRTLPELQMMQFNFLLYRPSDRVRLKNANYAIFSGQIVRLERPIMR